MGHDEPRNSMLATPLQIGSLRLETNLLLAPIAGWCDLAWRMTVRRLGGVGLACTDLLSPVGLLCGSEATADLARTNDFDKPIGMQLYGSDPALLADGARWCVDRGATVVDINMGCPVDKVCKKDGGSKLMTIPGTAVAIADAVRRAIPDSVPMTAKMRLGWTDADAEHNVAGALACQLIAAGAAAITVHGRTTEQRFKGSVRRDGIRRVVETVGERFGAYDGTSAGGPPVIGNGDVRTPDDVMELIGQTGCAGVMIGRGAFARPWIFRQAWARQTTGDEGRVEESEKLDTVLYYFDRLREFRGDANALFKLGQKISWLGKDINGSHCRPLKDAIREARSADDVYSAVQAWRELSVRSGAESLSEPVGIADE
ncbi:MAG: tRNA-dihydrouridine synthase family protein [Phycisphaeraceae bacterium]|nr:tRNA-dihydrouridine synthase family protein [Phycisphaeraceae bacterium]MCW5764236.1 tRNA-dihydrouridine synthase family protein [Phycisphaeraceae bacterium]